MPPIAPAVLSTFELQVVGCLDIVGPTEALWLTSPPTTHVRRLLKVPQLEALYESAFLRIFTAWESYLEDLLVHMMAGYSTPSYSPRPATGGSLYETLAAARVALFAGRPYLLWHDAATVARRSGEKLVGCPIQRDLIGALGWLANVSAVRHRIAHSSPDAAAGFRAASMSLTGADHRGKPGRLLRAADLSDPLNQPKWKPFLNSNF